MSANFNTSELEENIYEDIEHDDYSNGLSDLYIFYIFSAVFLAILVILALVVISADIFLVCVICRFKRLRTRTNMYILNCSILNILYIISIPIFSILAEFVTFHYSCLRISTVNLFLILYMLFAFGLALDWFLSGYIPNVMQKYNTFYKYVFAAAYVLIFIESSAVLFVCNESHILLRSLIFNALYIIILIVAVILNILEKKVILRNKNSYKTSYSLTIANIILFSFLPFLIIAILSHVFVNGPYLTVYITVYGGCIPMLIALGHPILVVYMLGKRNKYFKMAYMRSLKRSANGYGDENLDEGSDDENDVGNCGARVNYVTKCEQEPKLTIDV